jgi:hypothetical protein
MDISMPKSTKIINIVRCGWYSTLLLTILFVDSNLIFITISYIALSMQSKIEFYLLSKIFKIKNKTFNSEKTFYALLFSVSVISATFFIFGTLTENLLIKSIGFFLALMTVDLAITNIEIKNANQFKTSI